MNIIKNNSLTVGNKSGLVNPREEVDQYSNANSNKIALAFVNWTW